MVALRLLAVVLEGVLAEAVEGHAAQVARGDDAVGVDVVAAQRAGAAADDAHARLELRRDISRPPARRRRAPRIAAAATIAGDMSSVRPVGEPWRPLKLRLLDDAQSCVADQLVGVHRQAHRAAGLAPLEARGAEDLVEALRLGLARHLLRARHDERAHAGATCPLRATRAASRRSEMRPLVQEPMKATSIFVPAIGSPARSFM